MPEPERYTIVVPTYLGRRDADLDKIGLIAAGVVAFWLHQPENAGVPWSVMAIPLLLITVEVLSGEQATEWKFLGSVATGIRSKLGHRRAHEWIQAFAHYWHLAIWPVWRTTCLMTYGQYVMARNRQSNHAIAVLTRKVLLVTHWLQSVRSAAANSRQ